MRNTILASMIFACLACFSVRGEATPWFSEDGPSFHLNADHLWHYIPGTATYAEGLINSHHVDDLEGRDLEVKYNPAGAASTAVVSNEVEISFNDVGDENQDSRGSLVGLQVVVGFNGSHVFAALQPAEGSASWLITDVPGETNVLYQVTIVTTYTDDGGFIHYSGCVPGGASFDIADVPLPKRAVKPTEYALVGECSVARLAAWLDGVSTADYHRWRPLGGVYTWKGGVSILDGDYDVFDVEHGVDLGYTVETGRVFSAEIAGLYTPPGSGLRLTNAVNVAAGTTLLHFGGMIVEPGAGGASVSAEEMRFGDPSAASTTYFRFLDNATLGAAGTVMTLYGDITIEIAAGKTLDLSAASSVTLDPNTFARLHFVGGGTIKLPSGGLVAEGPVTLDYSGTTSGFKLQGSVAINGSTAFKLPDGTSPGGSGYRLVDAGGSVTGGESSTKRSLTVDSENFIADTTVTDGALVYTRQSYANWTDFPGVFTWAGGSSFAAGSFREFDAANSCDTDVIFTGGETAADVPGWGDGVFRDFISIFRDRASEGQALCRDAGYVLRFADIPGSGGTVSVETGSWTFGGLLVELGAHGCSIDCDEYERAMLRFGPVASLTSTNRIEIHEDFAITCATNVELVGRSHIEIDAEKTLSVTGLRTGTDRNACRSRPYLSFAGGGILDCGYLLVPGSATLDFSALERSPTDTPFIKGDVEVSDLTRLVLPASLTEGTAYRVCDGTLTMTSGVRPVALGDGEFEYKTVTVDSANGTVSWSAASSVNVQTLSDATVSWSSLAGLIAAGDSVELKLTRDVRLTIDQSGVSFPALLVTGPYRLQIVMRNNATFTSVFVGRGTSCEYVYLGNPKSASFNTEMTVLGGMAYDTAFEGYTTGSSVATWSRTVTVLGPLIVRNRLSLSSDANVVDTLGSLCVEEGAEFSLNGAPGQVGGRIEVEKGATLSAYEDFEQKKYANNIFVHDGSDFTLVVKGDLGLDTTSQTLAEGGTVELHGGGRIFCNAGNSTSIKLESPACLHVCRGTDDSPAELSASVVYDADGLIVVEEDATLLMDGATTRNGGVNDPCGSGTIEIPAGVTVPFTNDFFCVGGVIGEGTACFYSDPSASLAGPSLMSSTWTGQCLIQLAALEEFDPARCGNPGSTIVFDGAHGYFAKNVASTAPFVMERQADGTSPSLDVTSGYAESGESVPNMLGDGVLQVSTDGSGNGDHRFFIEDPTTYLGSYGVGSAALGGIVLGTADYLDRLDEFGSALNGQIAVVTGSVDIAANAWWSAPSGINVYSNAVVTDWGTILTPVVGEGSVRYYGTLSDDFPEQKAKFNNAETWHGTVEIRDGVFTSRDFGDSGNVNSRILLENVTGSLSAQVSETTLWIVGTGLGIDGATGGVVDFRRIMGTGSLRIEIPAADVSTFRFRDVEDFTGQFILDAAQTSVLLGEDSTRDADGTLFVGNVRMHPELDWRAPCIAFLTNMTVIGATEGARLFKQTTDAYVDTTHTRVDIEDGIGVDERVWHGVVFDPKDNGIYLCKVETPPDMDIGGIRVEYGTDFTNLTAYVTVTNYWGGYEFNGRSVASLIVYNSEGTRVGAGDCEVTSNGVYVIGGADIPFGPGSDYHYEVEIYTDQFKTGERIDRDEDNANAAGVRRDGDWFYEDGESFAAAAPSALKTGDWIYDAGAAATNAAGEIAFDTVEAGGSALVKFIPHLGVSNDYVRVRYGDVAFDTFYDFSSPTGGVADIGGGFAAVTVACDYGAEPPEPYFAVWTSTDENTASGRFERVYAPFEATTGETYSVDLTINRQEGTLGYVLNDRPLTNAEGRVFFRMSAAARAKDYEFLFKGQGRLVDLEGDQHNANLAAVVNGDSTNQFASVDAAVGAATNAGDRVTLLWDASWRPDSADVGRTIRFDRDGFDLYIDPASTNAFTGGGYRLIDNGDGSFTVGVITYRITFQPNDALGSMPAQEFCVTNMVFNLISNAFVRTGYDFSHWNENENGRGLGSWSDGGEIDMSAYGLADKKLWAQWKIAVKTIVIEPADEYVYIERITTNGTDVAGVKYVGHETLAEREKGRGGAAIPVLYGSTLVVRFSTDIGKTMTTPDWKIDPGYRQYSSVSNSFRVANIGTNLPHYTNDVDKVAAGETPEPLDDLGIWAIVHGIPLEAVEAAPLYASASMKLGMSTLLTEEQEIVISEFKTESDRCTFKVTVGDMPLENPAKILPMIQVTGDLSKGWHQVEESKVSVDSEGTVTVLTDADASFVKIVIR